MPVHETPPDLSPGARALWDGHLAVLAEDEEYAPTDLRLLVEAVTAAALADKLSAVLDVEGYTVTTTRGDRPHPLLAEVDRAAKRSAMMLKQLHAADRASSSAANGASRWARSPR